MKWTILLKQSQLDENKSACHNALFIHILVKSGGFYSIQLPSIPKTSLKDFNPTPQYFNPHLYNRPFPWNVVVHTLYHLYCRAGKLLWVYYDSITKLNSNLINEFILLSAYYELFCFCYELNNDLSMVFLVTKKYFIRSEGKLAI